MKNNYLNKIKRQNGAEMVEYVIALSALLAVFVILGILFRITAVNVTKRSVQAVKSDVPCTVEQKGGKEGVPLNEECL